MGATQTKYSQKWYVGCKTEDQIRVMWDMLIDGQLFADVRAIEALLASFDAMTSADFAVGPTVRSAEVVCVKSDTVAQLVGAAVEIDRYRGIVLVNHHLKTVEFYDLYSPWVLLPSKSRDRIRTCFSGYTVVPPVDRVPAPTAQSAALANTPLASSCVFRSVWALWTRLEHPTTKPEDLTNVAFGSIRYRPDPNAVVWGDSSKPDLLLDAFVRRLARHMAQKIDYQLMIRRCVKFPASDQAECIDDKLDLTAPPPRPPSPTMLSRARFMFRQ